jgi:hypothetical protein
VSTAAPAASTSHGPDDVDLAVQLALAGQLPEARRLLDRAAQAGKDEARIVAAGSPDRPLVGVAFSSSGDAFSVISEKGDEYRFELPSAALRVHAVPRVNGGSMDDLALDDPPEITAVAQGPDAHPRVLRDALRSWNPPDLPMPARERVIDQFRSRHPVSLESPAGGPATRLQRRRQEPTLFPGTGCYDCRFFELALSPGGALLAANYGISNDRVLRVFRVPSGVEIPYTGAMAMFFAFDHAEKRLAIMEMGGSLIVHPIASPARGTVIGGAQGAVSGMSEVVWSPDDTLLIAAGSPVLLVLDATTGAARCQGSGGSPIAVSRRGDQIATVVEGAPTLVGTADCKVIRALKPLAGDPRQLAFSPDGARLAQLDGNGTVTIVDIPSGTALGSIRVGWGGAAIVAPPPARRVELLGDRAGATRLLGCEVRGKELPAAVCVDRLASVGQAAATLAGRP